MKKKKGGNHFYGMSFHARHYVLCFLHDISFTSSPRGINTSPTLHREIKVQGHK